MLEGCKALSSSSFVENDANQRLAGMELTPVTALNTKVQPEHNKDNVQCKVKINLKKYKETWFQSFFFVAEVRGPDFAGKKNILEDNLHFSRFKKNEIWILMYSDNKGKKKETKNEQKRLDIQKHNEFALNLFFFHSLSF